MPHDFDEAAKKHLTQGMTDADMEATLKVANARNEIIIFRSTGPWPHKYIETLECPTKDMGVKGKSSTWGPMAGLIPVDSILSKAIKPEDVKSGVEANKKSLAAGKVIAVPLTLAEATLQLLLTEKLQDDKNAPPRSAIASVTHPDNDPLTVYIIAEKRDGKEVGTPKDWGFLGKRKGPKDAYAISYFPTRPDSAAVLKGNDPVKVPALLADAKPVEVLARPSKPGAFMTGDYDLFAICPAWANWGPKDKRSDNFMDDPKYAARLRTYQTELEPAQIKTLDELLVACEKSIAQQEDVTKYKGALKGKIDLDRQMKGKEQILKAGKESTKIICSKGCVDPTHDNDPLEFEKDDESCRKCKAPAMFWFNCSKGCLGEVKDKAGKPKLYVFKPEDTACPKCKAPAVSAARSMRDFEDGTTVGNVTFRVLEVIAALNKEMKATEFNKRVHHNQEAGRWHAPADISEAFPLTVFHPDRPGLKDAGYKWRIAIIDDVADLKAYFLNIFSIGYYVPLNFAWDIKNLNAALISINEGKKVKAN